GVLRGTLPHEVTHTILADYFRCPLPRWADEGASTLAELPGELERSRALCRRSLRDGRLLPLTRLFALTQYPPRDVTAFYAQSASVTEYLVGLKDRKTLLAFVKDGMKKGWEKAVKTHYDIAGVAELEKKWLRSLKNKKRISALRRRRHFPPMTMTPSHPEGGW